MPLLVRVIVGAAVAVFVYGTAVHADQLAAGAWHPYRGLPGWLAGYFVSLTVLDPAAAGLLACRRRAGLLLGCAVLLSDAAGNGYANYAVRPGQGITGGRAGQAVVTVLAIALLAVAPPPARLNPAGVAAWTAVAVGAAAWELLALFLQPTFTTDSPAHPTLSYLANGLLASWPGRSAVIFGWLAFGWYLARL